MKSFQGRTWAIGGGKGGIGKSFIAANLACAMALKGYRVVLIDADLAGANLHTLFGIRYPEKTLNHFLKKEVTRFSEILQPTPLDNLHLICGAPALLEIANPKYQQKQKLIRAMAGLDCDITIIDIGAGSNFNNLDFFNMADRGILVTSPTPTALQNSYAFLKLAINRRLVNLLSSRSFIKKEVATALGEQGEDKNIFEILNLARNIDKEAGDKLIKVLIQIQTDLIVNMATEKEGGKIAETMASTAYNFLRIRLPYLGHIVFDRVVEHSIRRMQPIQLAEKNTITEAFTTMAETLADDEDLPSPGRNVPEHRKAVAAAVQGATL